MTLHCNNLNIIISTIIPQYLVSMYIATTELKKSPAIISR